MVFTEKELLSPNILELKKKIVRVPLKSVFCKFVYMCACLSVCVFVFLSVRLFVCDLSVCVFACLFTCLFFCLFFVYIFLIKILLNMLGTSSTLY